MFLLKSIKRSKGHRTSYLGPKVPRSKLFFFLLLEFSFHNTMAGYSFQATLCPTNCKNQFPSKLEGGGLLPGNHYPVNVEMVEYIISNGTSCWFSACSFLKT